MMYELEKSDSLVVPRKSANKAGLLAAEPMEGSGGIARNANLQRTARTQSRTRRVTRADRHTCGCGCIGCASSTRDRSRMREFRSYGSVRGAPSNGRPYRKNWPTADLDRSPNRHLTGAKLTLWQLEDHHPTGIDRLPQRVLEATASLVFPRPVMSGQCKNFACIGMRSVSLLGLSSQ